MRIIWSPTTRCRGFFVSTNNKINIVSSNLTSNARGRLVPGGLTLVVDDDDQFCDLELELMPSYRLQKPILPSCLTNLSHPLETFLKMSSQTTWLFDESSGYLLISLLYTEPESWYQIECGSMAIGTDDQGALNSIIFHGVVEDQTGQLEATWLDELEKQDPSID